MKPLKSELQDEETLRDLGSASVQIVHDLKNQLNGLKLYATFLRKRMEKSERPADELETIAKLIAGLERAATDMTVLVRYGRPLDLRRQPRTDLARILENAAEGHGVEREEGSYEGEFDQALLAEALKSITSHAGHGGDAQASADGDGPAPVIRLRRDGSVDAPRALIEWSGARSGGDAFASLAGGEGLRMALAARIIRAHGGEVGQEQGSPLLRASLPLSS
ncbi:MAG TPA: hypothetical protein VM934_15115 [Pyrinomonadaceae bacterium]|nr:hypothetical protein [Pyrinomonadaceae bacterium]